MNRSTASGLGAGLLAAVDFGVIMAPSVVLVVTANQGGMPNTHGLDLFVASGLVAAVHARVVWGRLRDEVSHAGRVVDVWLAAFDSLVVLALGVTGLLLFILGGFAEQHAALINRGWPVLALWTGILILAVAISEFTGRCIFRWLEPPATTPTEPAHAGDDRQGRAVSH